MYMKKMLQTNTAKLGLGLLVFSISMSSYSNTPRGLDPTKPLFGSKQATVVKVGNKLALESILRSGSSATAIINGKALKVNDNIGEYRLTKINNDSVVLSSPEKEVRLSLFASVKKL